MLMRTLVKMLMFGAAVANAKGLVYGDAASQVVMPKGICPPRDPFYEPPVGMPISEFEDSNWQLLWANVKTVEEVQSLWLGERHDESRKTWEKADQFAEVKRAQAASESKEQGIHVEFKQDRYFEGHEQKQEISCKDVLSAPQPGIKCFGADSIEARDRVLELRPGGNDMGLLVAKNELQKVFNQYSTLPNYSDAEFLARVIKPSLQVFERALTEEGISDEQKEVYRDRLRAANYFLEKYDRGMSLAAIFREHTRDSTIVTPERFAEIQRVNIHRNEVLRTTTWGDGYPQGRSSVTGLGLAHLQRQPDAGDGSGAERMMQEIQAEAGRSNNGVAVFGRRTR